MNPEKVLVMSVSREVKDGEIPEGVYRGSWSTHTVIFNVGDVTYRLTVSQGMRGLNIPCTVTVDRQEGISVSRGYEGTSI